MKPPQGRSCAHPRTNLDVTREFWAWTCAHPARLGRLVFLACWTAGWIVAALDVLAEITP